ncbi:ComF family protein [Magnetovibrio sp. PR-2]|uniref:ComF family protein n=1 Tax=Magnetovibrio sp. PR-2 TaxID=3120356 RepID=UPI002FCE0F38
MQQNGFRILSRLVDVVLPPTCGRCGVQVDTPQTLCASCWSELTFLGPPSCEACAHPFEYEVPDQTLCGACVREHPPFDRARAALVYDDQSRDLVLGFKHADRTETAGLLAKWMRAAGADLLAEADALVPVPLHWTRLFQRRYNQSALLAKAVGKLADTPVLHNTLKRKRKTLSQGRMGRKARARNVQGAFVVPPKLKQRIEGKAVVLIDDVYTTGATIWACAKVLKRAGAARVDVLVLARVVRDFA